MQSFNKIFFRGLLTLLPITVTIYILYSAIIILENFLGSVLRQIWPGYIPGIGLILTLVLIFLFGLLLNNLIAVRFVSWLERRLASVPFIQAIYSPLRDLMNLFSKKDTNSKQSVVLVKVGESGAFAMGLVTRENFSDLPIEKQATDRVAVYFPFSYGLGGYTFLVPRESVTEINIPIEKAMSLAITGWVKVDQAKSKDGILKS